MVPEAMKVAIASYQTLFQRWGGLQMKIRATALALQEFGLEARLVNMVEERLSSFDILHVFAASNGNHRIVELASSIGIPVVISPILQTDLKPMQRLIRQYGDAVLHRLTKWQVSTSFGEIRKAMQLADRVLPMGKRERDVAVQVYGVEPARIVLVPNGIAERFFQATPERFREKTGIEGDFVLCVSNVSSYKGQLRLVSALDGLDVQIVLIGETPRDQQSYLDQCVAVGGKRLHVLGPMAHDSDDLASAYAAASVFVLLSNGESWPNVMMEALAADTPCVVTKYNGMDLEPDGRVLVTVDPHNAHAVRKEVCRILNDPPPAGAARALVLSYNWSETAKRLVSIYRDVLQKPGAIPAAAIGTQPNA